MSIRHELRPFQLEVPVRGRSESGAPEVSYTQAGTLLCAVLERSGGFEDGEVYFEHQTVLCPKKDALQPEYRLRDGGRLYTVEEAVSVRRWCVAHCRSEVTV